jgi:PASTA domain
VNGAEWQLLNLEPATSEPAPLLVPDVVGKKEADATSQLEALDLKVATKQETSVTVPAGDVIRTDPAPKSSVTGGSTVTIWVSSGTPPSTDKPTLISPADGAILSEFPRTTVLTWSEVPGADKYVVEIAYFDPPNANWVAYSPVTVNMTSYTFDMADAVRGRWRVTAYTPAAPAQPLGPTEWWTFTYTR